MAALSTLRISVRRLVDEEDLTNTHFTESEINDYLNQATLFLATQMEWPLQTSTAVLVTDQSLYSLPADFISLIDVYSDNSKLDVLEREDLGDISSRWQDTPSGTPQTVYKADNRVLGLHPAPNAEQNGNLIQIQYVSTPATLTLDADVPDLHEAFQICLPFYAAALCEKKKGNTKALKEDIELYESHRKALVSKLQRFSDDLYRFRWTL